MTDCDPCSLLTATQLSSSMRHYETGRPRKQAAKYRRKQSASTHCSLIITICCNHCISRACSASVSEVVISSRANEKHFLYIQVVGSGIRYAFFENDEMSLEGDALVLLSIQQIFFRIKACFS